MACKNVRNNYGDLFVSTAISVTDYSFSARENNLHENRRDR